MRANSKRIKFNGMEGIYIYFACLKIQIYVLEVVFGVN